MGCVQPLSQPNFDWIDSIMSPHALFARRATAPALVFIVCYCWFDSLAWAQSAAPAASGQSQETANEIVVTGNPLGSGLFELANPSTQLSGSNLDFRRSSTLGETLSGELGIGSTYFGPNSSRPVIRGLDADRVRMLQNGASLVDASSLSFDHAAAVDPLIAERIEVVRGPAALLYGGSAIGGVVNVLDNRIPSAPITQPQGRGDFRLGQVDRERSGAAVVEAGNGRLAVHADGYQRDHRDTKIPGFARSARQRAIDDPALDQPNGRLPNTSNRGDGGALGGALTWDHGHAGVSYASLRSNYGTPAEDSVRIEMQKETIGLASEIRKLNPLIDSIKLQFSHSDYQHQEKDRSSGAVNTTFKNRGHEARLELKHSPVAGFTGVLGASLSSYDFSALGEEAFVPSNRNQSRALFLFEEYRLGDWRFTFGIRQEQSRVRSDGDSIGSGAQGPGAVRFGAPVSRSFNAQSASLGSSYNFDSRWSVAANLAFTERTPTPYELFANGPHAATGGFEVGNPNFEKERSQAIDIALRHRSGANQWSVSLFQTRFSNFLLLAPTGQLRGADGSFENPATPGVSTTDIPADLPEYQYRQVPALFRGAEIGGRWRALDQGGTLDLDAKLDFVRAIQSANSEPLPRIAPVRFSFGALYQTGPWQLRGELTQVAAQNRVAANEPPSEGYALANAMLSYRWRGDGTNWQVYLRGNNLLNVEARNHASLIKEIAPLPGRGLVLGVRGNF